MAGKCILLILAIATISHGEVILVVNPAQVQPGVSPSFSINCGVLNSEEAKIVSMAVTRRTAGLGNVVTGEAEVLVSISALTPRLPEVNPRYQGVTALGQIVTFESELGSYVQLVWPNPDVEDLGDYTCETVIIGETGQLVTLLAQAQVTSGNALIDRILLSLSRFGTTLDTFNTTLLDLQVQVDNISAVQRSQLAREAIRKVEEEDKETTTMLPESFMNTTSGEELLNTTVAPTKDPQASQIDRLVTALENVGSKLDQFNRSIVAMEKKLDRLDREIDGKNETDDEEKDRPNHVITFFNHNTSMFFLISGPSEFNTYSAQALCDSQGLYLAEVQSPAELDAIFERTAPILLRDQLVLIGGRRVGGSAVWRYQESGTEVTFFGGPAPPAEETNEATCLALTKSPDGMAMDDVACSKLSSTFILCEDYYVPTDQGEAV